MPTTHLAQQGGITETARVVLVAVFLLTPDHDEQVKQLSAGSHKLTAVTSPPPAAAASPKPHTPKPATPCSNIQKGSTGREGMRGSV